MINAENHREKADLAATVKEDRKFTTAPIIKFEEEENLDRPERALSRMAGSNESIEKISDGPKNHPVHKIINSQISKATTN